MTVIVKELRDALVEAGASPASADAAAAAVVSLEQAATTIDIAELRGDVKADIAELKASTQADIAELKVAIAELKADVYRALWIQGGAIVAILSGVGTLIRIWS